MTSTRPLRLWPVYVLLALMLLTRFIPGHVGDGMSSYWMIVLFGPLISCLILILWWPTLSRATGKEKLVGFLGLIALLVLSVAISHPTMRGPGTIQYALPIGMAAFAIAVILWSSARPFVRTSLALIFAALGFGYATLLRSEGTDGDYQLVTYWRWQPSPEDLMLSARKSDAKEALPAPSETIYTSSLSTPEWPGFRGADRSGQTKGPKLATDWATHPPRQLWKIPAGPSWSSFAVAGKLLFTQDQRGPMETVVCYDADTGKEIWTQQTETRLEDPLGGPGPRATPTIGKGGLFTTGATGTFQRLNPATGEVIWKHDLKTLAGREAPMWGFSASPLVVGSVVIVHTGGVGDKGLLAFDIETGKLIWSIAAGTDSYSSPQLNRIGSEELVLMLTNDGLLFVDPATGKIRLNYEWKYNNYRALQPNLMAENTFLLPTAMNTGTRAIQVTAANGQLSATELWTSPKLNPDFTDLISHQGYAYGVLGGLFTCVDLKTGERQWREGRYGKGQAILLQDSGLLLISAEQGQVVLVKADPTTHTEVTSFKALEGKTWNHPVVVGDRLYVRNSQEAAAYQLPLATP
jgi:outer membrane protein assembly factor BamB